MPIRARNVATENFDSQTPAFEGVFSATASFPKLGGAGQSDGRHLIKVMTILGLFWPFWPAKSAIKNFDSQTPAFEGVFSATASFPNLGIAGQSDGRHFIKVMTILGRLGSFGPAVENSTAFPLHLRGAFKRDG